MWSQSGKTGKIPVAFVSHEYENTIADATNLCAQLRSLFSRILPRNFCLLDVTDEIVTSSHLCARNSFFGILYARAPIFIQIYEHSDIQLSGY